MIDILMVLKTQNLKNDQRVLKEIKSLRSNGANIEVFVAKNCNMTQDELGVPLRIVNIVGGAAPNNLIIRILGIIQFYIKNILYILLKKNKIDKVWICDPIMFGLVILLKILRPRLKIIWDHHELPPTWFLSNKLLMKLFKKAYLISDIIIHANLSRQKYLESLLDVEANQSYIISNYPLFSLSEEEKLDDKAEKWMTENKFVYLQNSLQNNRFGAEVITNAIKNGYSVFHAGKVDLNFIKKYNLDESKIFLAGYLNPRQMNRALNKCQFTVILYKKDSLNQIYCDANRLYQAMSLGVFLIIGDNPTMVETVEKNQYREYIVVSDIIHIDSILKSIKNDLDCLKHRNPIVLSWQSYNSIFNEIVNT